MYFPDPVYEEDLLKQNEARDTKFQNLKKNLSIDIAKNLIAIKTVTMLGLLHAHL